MLFCSDKVSAVLSTPGDLMKRFARLFVRKASSSGANSNQCKTSSGHFVDNTSFLVAFQSEPFGVATPLADPVMTFYPKLPCKLCLARYTGARLSNSFRRRPVCNLSYMRVTLFILLNREVIPQRVPFRIQCELDNSQQRLQ